MSVSNIGNIHFINQNQSVAIDAQAKFHAKELAQAQELPPMQEIAVVEESNESAKTRTDLDEERSLNQEGKKDDRRKKAEFFGIIIEEDEDDENIVNVDENSKIFDKLV